MSRGRPKKIQISNVDNDYLLDQKDNIEPPESREKPAINQVEKEKDIGTGNEIIKIQNEKLKNVVVSCLDGIEINFDAEGIAEVKDERISTYLLSIPSYKKI